MEVGIGMDVCGKFEEHKKSVRIGAADSNSSFVSAPQAFQVHPQLDIRTVTGIDQLLYDTTDTICPRYNNRVLPENWK